MVRLYRLMTGHCHIGASFMWVCMKSYGVIIIIKKVKIIVTLSIKNTAGALYKSQIKGENRYCLWLRNSNVFRRRRK